MKNMLLSHPWIALFVIYKHSSCQGDNHQYALKRYYLGVIIMVAVDTGVDLSSLIDAVTSGNLDQIIATAREYLQRDNAVDSLIGHIGMIAAHRDLTGHRTITLTAASMLGRFIPWIPAPVDTPEQA